MPASSEPTDAVLENLDWIRGLARSLLSDEAAADDLVQDTWLRAHGLDVPAGPARKRWLARVMRNLARDRFRGRARRDDREKVAARHEALPSNAELIEAAEVREQLARWVKELPQPYRRVALLHWLEGIDPREIASRDDAPIATVRSQLARARQILRERAARNERGNAAAWLAVAAGFPPKQFAAAAVATPIPLAGLMLMKAVACVVAGLTVMAVFVVTRLGDTDGPPTLASSEDAEPVGEALAADTAVVAVHQPDVAADRIEASTDTIDPEPAESTAGDVVEYDVLRVLVEDGNGSPVGGIPVTVFGVFERHRYDLSSESTNAESGTASFEIVPDDWPGKIPGGAPEWLEVGIDFPGLDLERVVVDASAIPDETIELRAPEHGALTVRIQDSEGAPVCDHSWVYVTPLFEDPTSPGRLNRGERHDTQTAGAAEVAIPFVASGTRLRVEVYEEGLYEGRHVLIDPLTGGEHRTVTLVSDRTIPYATGRVVIANQALPSGRWIEARFTPGGSTSTPYEDDGSFVLPLSRVTAGPGESFTAMVTVQLPDPVKGWASARTYSGRFRSIMPSPGGSVDVGVVALRPPAVLAAGRVVDTDGKPFPGAAVSIYEKFNQREDPEDFGWNWASVPWAYADENGVFEVRFEKPAGEYAIRCQAEGWIDRGAVRFQSGTRDLELTLDRERHLRGRVRLPDGLEAKDMRIRAEVEGATREERAYTRFVGEVAHDGSFWLNGLRAANVRLDLLMADSETPMAVLEDVRPSLDPDDPPEAVDPWDCSGHLRHFDFAVLRHDGTPAPQALAVYGSQSIPVVRGRVDATVKISDDDEVFVVAPGHLPTRFPARAAPKKVQLDRGIPVHVEWSAELPTPPEGAVVSLGLLPEDPSWLPTAQTESGSTAYWRGQWMGSTPLLPGQKEATVHVGAPGRYRPRWTVTHPSNDVVLEGVRRRSFANETGRYEIEVGARDNGNVRWSVAPDMDAARTAMKGED